MKIGGRTGAAILSFPEGNRLSNDDEEGIRILKEQTYLPKSIRLARKVRKEIAWILRPLFINDREPREGIEDTIEKENKGGSRNHSKTSRKLRIMVHKMTKKKNKESVEEKKPGPLTRLWEQTGI